MRQDDDNRDLRDRLIRLEERLMTLTTTVNKLQSWLFAAIGLVLVAVGKNLLALLGIGG